MEIDPMESANSAAEENAASNSRLTTMVAITVALLATFLGVCKVKDDNIVQAMQQAQADSIDQWAFYQARNLREEIGKATLTQMKLAADTAPVAEKPKYAEALFNYQNLVQKEDAKKGDAQKQALDAQATYNALNYHDDQFDLSDALIAIAISLLAVTALTRKWWLYWLSLVPTALGVFMGLAGLLGWQIHPDAIMKLLS